MAISDTPADELTAALREARVRAFLASDEPQSREGGSPDAGDPARAELNRLLDLAGKVYSAAVTEETRETYAWRWKRFVDWCERRSLPSLPASPEVAMMYLADSAEEGNSVGTLRGWLAAINRIHIEAGCIPPGDDPALRLFWKGLVRTLPPVEKATPVDALRIGPLRQVCRTIDANAIDPVELRDRAIIGLHLLGLNGPSTANLEWDQVDLDDDLLRITVPPLGRLRRERVYEATASGMSANAMLAWRDHVASLDEEIAGRVFWHFDVRTSYGTPLTEQGVYRAIKARLTTLGPDRENPATPEQAMALLGRKHAQDLRDKAILLLGFAAAARRGEIVRLRWSDLREVDGGLTMRIRRSKTDMEGKVQPIIGIPYGQSPLTCPVTAVREWRERVEAQFGDVGPEDWVFTSAGRRGRADRIGTNRIQTETLTRIVDRRAKDAGVEGNWGGRSIRAGFISTAADLEIPLEQIATQSRHRTLDTLAVYIRQNDPFRRNPAGRVGL